MHEFYILLFNSELMLFCFVQSYGESKQSILIGIVSFFCSLLDRWTWYNNLSRLEKDL